MMQIVVCYRTTRPTIYNAGTRYEKSCDHFLAYYTYRPIEQVREEVERLNTERPERLWNGERINWTEVAYFYVDEQEEMY